MSTLNNIIKLIRYKKKTLFIISILFTLWLIPTEKFSPILKPLGIDNIEENWNLSFIVLIIIIIVVMFYQIFRDYKEFTILDNWKNKTLNQNEIKKLKITKRISIIGLSNSGKTTLINKLTYKSASQNRTQGIEGKILCVDNKKVCFIDISGESIAQQMKAIDLADFIILVVDHSYSSKSMIIQKNRISETKNLLKKIEDHLEINNLKTAIPSIVLINKKDLWAKTKKSEDLLSEYSELPNVLNRIFKNESKLYHYSNLENKNNNSEELRKIIDHILGKIGE